MPALLLADDSLVVQRMVAMTFAAEGIEVLVVNDGEEAIARIGRDHPDIVLAAVATPKRSGYDVAAYVNSTPGLAGTPVLLLAGAFEAVDERRLASIRCDGVLTKPLDPHQLVARVRESIARAAAQRVSAEPAPEKGVDAYFDQLDAAFARRSASTPVPRSDDEGEVPTLEAVLDPSAAAAAPPVTDALIEEVTRRVVERLATPAVRDLVADIVSETAERLIRDEIARVRGGSGDKRRSTMS